MLPVLPAFRLRAIPGLVLALICTPLSGQTTLPTLEQAAIIGCFVCEGPQAFGAIQAVAVGPDGGVVVADRDAPMIRRFDPRGRPVVSFGRRGEGPGEFGMRAGLAVRPDGLILIGDLLRFRLTELTAESEFLRAIQVPSTVMALSAAPRGDWVAYQISNWSDFTATVHLLDEASDSAATPLPTTAGVIPDTHGSGAAAGLLSSAAGSAGIVAVGFGGEHYRILILNPGGELLREIVRDIPPHTPDPGGDQRSGGSLSTGPGSRHSGQPRGRCDGATG